MRVETFQATAAKVANVLGRKTGIQVTYGGTAAWTAPGRIHLPALPAGTTMTPHQVDVFRGFLNHEVGHQRYTEQGYWGAAFPLDDDQQPLFDELENHVTNWLEDVQTDTAEVKDYPGADRDLLALYRWSTNFELKRLAQKPDYYSTAARVALGLMFEEIWKHRGGLRKSGVQGLTFKNLGPRFVQVQNAINEGIPQLTSTQDTHELAKKILEILQDAVDNYDPSEGEPQEGGDPGEGDPEENDQGESSSEDSSEGSEAARGTGSGTGDGDEVSQDEKPGSPVGENGPDESKGKPSKGKGGKPNKPGKTQKPQEAGDLREKPEFPSGKLGDMGDFIKSIMGGKNRPVPGTSDDTQDQDDPNPHETPIEGSVDHYHVPAGTHLDKIFVPSHSDLDQYRQERARLAAVTSSAKKMVTQFLRSKEMKAWTRGMEEGTFDDEAAADVLLREKRIFKQRRMRTLQNTAICLMIDLSSSMDEELVRQAAIVLSEALAGFPKIKVMVAGFRTNYEDYAPDPKAGRHDGIDVILFKNFDEPHQKVIGRYGAVRTNGCTPLGEGMAFAFEALVQRPEPRRVLWLVTDGAPYYTMGNSSHRGCAANDYILMSWIHEKAKRERIETFALGIGNYSRTSTLTNLTDGFGKIYSIDQLPGALLQMAKKAIRTV